MGSTSNFGLPYPEGSDVPDIPRDIAALANALDNALGQMVMPQSRRWYGYNNPFYFVNGWPTSDSRAQMNGSDLTFSNPHPKLSMRVKVEVSGWARIVPGTGGRVIYITPAVTGGTYVHSVEARPAFERSGASGVYPHIYTDIQAYQYRDVGPKQTTSSYVRVHTYPATVNSHSDSTLRYVGHIISPVAWVHPTLGQTSDDPSEVADET